MGQLRNFVNSYITEMFRTKCSFRKKIDNLIGSPVRGGGAVQDAMGRWGHGRCHGTPVKGSRAVKDTMGLLSRVVGP